MKTDRVQVAIQKLQVLELEPDATIHQVKRAYRTLAMVWHPDRFSSNDKLRNTAQEKLKKINEAYEWLIKNKDLLPLKLNSKYNFDTGKDYTTSSQANKEPQRQNPNPASQQNSATFNNGGIKIRYFILIAAVFFFFIWINNITNPQYNDGNTSVSSSSSSEKSTTPKNYPNQNENSTSTDLNISPSSLIVSNNSDINLNQRVKIFQKKYVSNPDTSFQLTQDKLLYLKISSEDDDTFGNKELKLILLGKVGDEWGQLKYTSITKGTNSTLNSAIKSIQIVPINNSVYLYFEKNISGGSLGNRSIEYTLFEINSNEKYFIEYLEIPNRQYTNTDFKKSPNLSSNDNISTYLEDKVNNSPQVYRPNEREKLVREFIIANERALESLAESNSKVNSVKFKKVTTKEKIFSTELNDSLRIINASIVSRIENKDFIVISIFKGAVVGYSKDTNEFFCVWAPESMYSWISNLRFDSVGNLILYDRRNNKPAYQVNLYTSTYLKLE